jgi:uncharacterized protein YutE (UPF0331/DUF86 family)
MYDIIRLNDIIKNIEEYFLTLKNIGLNKENIESDEKFYSSSMIIFGILNRLRDLAEEIIKKNDFGMPSNFEQYFDVLSKKGILSKNLAVELKKLVKDRNLFAHEYYNMDRKQVLSISKRIYYVKDFVERIKEVIKK